MTRFKIPALVLPITALVGLLGTPALASAAAPAVPTTLTEIRAAHHPGYDRLVFQFAGKLPAQRSARYVATVFADPSGKVVPVSGSARLLVRFFASGVGKFLNQRSFNLPGLMQLVKAGSFESVLTYGVGVARKEPVHLFTLTSPSRVVIDIPTPYRTVTVHAFMTDKKAFANGKPSAKAVDRQAIPPALARGAMQRLFAGPTPAEVAAGLTFVSSEATGFTKLTISEQVARVRLTGGCNSHGSTLTIASEIIPTLKQFSTVRWVKIYDPAGHTEEPAGHSDSIPTCLEP
jgi:hypothetical protein